MMLRTFLSMMVLVAMAASALAHELPERPVLMASLDVASLNVDIATAVANGETWPSSPLQTVLHLFGGDTDAQQVFIEESKDKPENPRTAKITYIVDRMVDDALRGQWVEADLARQKDGTWRLLEARAAYRCWRAENSEAYQAAPCE